jgi:exopolyphosphatase / guanosine-5'-triphosphate,3'-diphosphate pyrophosphatase
MDDLRDEATATQGAMRWPGQLAAIDMGSNSFRLEIAQVGDEGAYRRLDYLKETVRLGAGLDADGRLTAEAQQRGLDCLARFEQRLRGFQPQQVRAVATQTLREARNRDEFLLKARTVLGRPIEVISGREEARLTFAGVARLQPSNRQRLVIDIGGRSTELILGRGLQPIRAESFGVGSVSLSMRYFGDGRYTEDAFREAQVAAGAEFEEALELFSREHWQEALGSSGTVGAVAQVLAANGQGDGAITPQNLRWMIDQCLRAGRMDRLQLAGLKDDRRPIVAGGLCILYTLAAHFDVTALTPAKGALRQGVVFDLADRLTARHRGGDAPARVNDVRDASVRELQRRFLVDVQQAERVFSVADALYQQVQPRAALEARRELRWACALHEIGMMVSHHDHHRHSAYLLAHVDAAGFSQSQQRRLADMVLGQRGGLRKLESAFEQDGFAWQVLCLRLAAIKCHARGPVRTERLVLARQGSDAWLTFTSDWADTHPRTVYLLREEAAAWARTDAPLSLVLAA